MLCNLQKISCHKSNYTNFWTFVKILSYTVFTICNLDCIKKCFTNTYIYIYILNIYIKLNDLYNFDKLNMTAGIYECVKGNNSTKMKHFNKIFIENIAHM